MESGARNLESSAIRVQVPEGVLFRDLGAEAVLLELESGRYYSLEDVGLRMWALLSRHGRLDLAHRELLEEYEVEAEELEQDLLAFVDRLAERRILERWWVLFKSGEKSSTHRHTPW